MSADGAAAGAEGAGAGAAAAGAAAAGGAAAGAEGGAAAAAADASKPYYEGFTDAGLRASPSIQLFKTPEELAKGYVSLEKRFGVDPNRRLDLPADPNDKEGMRAVYTKLGLPDKPEGYGLKLEDAAAPEDKATLGKFAAKAHELGLPAPMAKGLAEWFMGETAAQAEAAKTAMAGRIAEGAAALKTEWGQAYEAKGREIATMVGKYGDPDLAKAFTPDTLAANPNLAKFLAKMIDRMAEPGVAGGQSGDAAQANGGALTPDQARAQVALLEADPIKGVALRDKNHAMHKAVVAERTRLLAFTAQQA